jgi:hypothetical protein
MSGTGRRNGVRNRFLSGLWFRPLFVGVSGGFGVDSKGGFCAVVSTVRREGLGGLMPAEAAKPVTLEGGLCRMIGRRRRCGLGFCNRMRPEPAMCGVCLASFCIRRREVLRCAQDDGEGNRGDSARSVFCFLDSFAVESSLSLVFLKLAPSGNQIEWFGHLVGPIMGCYALVEGDFCSFIY